LKIVKNIQELKTYLKHNHNIGFVPTMGALHNGHKALIDRAKKENQTVVVSIFVNPTQFLDGEDFSKYPRTFERDSKICKLSGVDYLFYPNIQEVYFKDELLILAPKKRGFILDGLKRVGHFNGVLQVVLKLLNIVNPSKAYFGKKDAQQLILIQQMVKELFLDIKIVPVEIIRDRDMLALSSRNIYLSKDERAKALAIPKSLEMVSKLIMNGERDSNIVIENILNSMQNLDIEYVEVLKRDLEQIEKIEIGNTVILIAVKVGKTRLIDNLWI